MIRRLIGELKAPRLSSFTDVLGEALGRLALPPKTSIYTRGYATVAGKSA